MRMSFFLKTTKTTGERRYNDLQLTGATKRSRALRRQKPTLSHVTFVQQTSHRYKSSFGFCGLWPFVNCCFVLISITPNIRLSCRFAPSLNFVNVSANISNVDTHMKMSLKSSLSKRSNTSRMPRSQAPGPLSRIFLVL